MSSHRSKAKKKAFAWQAASVLLASGAVALFILPVAALIRPAPTTWDGSGARPVNVDAAAGGSDLSLMDAHGIADILLTLAPPKPEVPVEEVKPEPVPEGTEVGAAPAPAPGTGPQAAPKANWAYLGSAVTPRATRALVRIDQSQKFIRQGAELDGVKLLEVHDDHIMIEEGNEDARLQRRIDRAPFIASSLLDPPRAGPASAAKPGGAATPPPPTPPGSGATNAAKEAALAAAMNAHGKGKTGGPGNPARLVARIMQLSPEQRAQTFATLTSQTASYEDKIRAVPELGFDPEAGLDERREAVRALGLNPEDPDLLRILEDEMNGAARDQR